MRWGKRSGGRRPNEGICIDLPKLQRSLGLPFSERGAESIRFACEEMRRSNHHALGAEHLIVGVLEEGGPAAQLLISHRLTVEGARGQIAEALWEGDETPRKVELTPEAENILATAVEAAGMRGQQAIEPEHITYGFVCSGFEITSRILHMTGVDRQKLLQDSEQLL